MVNITKKHSIILSMVLILSLKSYGFDLIGYPAGSLDSMQGSTNFNYSWGIMDIEAGGITELGLTTESIKDIEFQKKCADLNLGLAEGFDFFIRFGTAELKPDENDNKDNIGGYIGKSHENILLGGGFKATLYEAEKIKWGFVTEMSWTKYEFDQISENIGGYLATLDSEANIFEVNISISHIYELQKNLSIYGGPFLHFVDGWFELTGQIDTLRERITFDISQESLLGGLVGSQVRVGDSINFCSEFQVTGSGYGVMGGLTWKF